MFTGIIEHMGEVVSLQNEAENLYISMRTPITQELKIDQSVAHNGVCLTVVAIEGDIYTVTVIKESLQKTNLGNLKVGDQVNIERCMKLGDRLDGHLVQGHVDQTAKCVDVVEVDGSWYFTFSYENLGNITVEKGSICVNGVSLTVVNSQADSFSVAIIPYTYNHTNFHNFKIGTIVNLEFDILGKYIVKMNQLK
ncbi:MAG: riboflavin synthase [Flavobacteriales bacterium]|nr:riboflavin synthase [Flavobacteriales bacterium]|tara:strand:+ start:891 stop:1475 length:585 start_codon:yes stop_codon:yes gene_type:complete